MNASPTLIALPFAVTLLLPIVAWGHGVHHEVGAARAVVVTMEYRHDQPMAHAAYEVFRQGDEQPYQKGETDALGRITFLPDRADAWRVRVHSRDGHGQEVKLTTDAAATPSSAGEQEAHDDRHERIVAGVGILFGLFGLIALFLRRRTSPA